MKKETAMEKTKVHTTTIPPELEVKLDSVGILKERIVEYEKIIKESQKSLLSYIKRHRLQGWTIKGKQYLGNFMSKQNERISKTMLRGMLAESLIERCTVRSKKYEWIKTSRIKASRKK